MHEEEDCQQDEGGGPSPVLSPGINKYGVLGPMLGSSLPERQGRREVSPAQVHKDV